MSKHDDLTKNMWPVMVIFSLLGLVFIFISHSAKSNVDNAAILSMLEIIRELGMGLIVAGAVGLVFEGMAHVHILGKALSNIEKQLNTAGEKQSLLLDSLESRVNHVGNEIVMASGMLRNATKVGIEAVYNGREEDFHRDLARSIKEAKGIVRIIGISLADICGYWGGKSDIHEAVEWRMKNSDPIDKFQILFSDPDGQGLRTRAKYEHPGMEYNETRAFRQTVAKISETLVIAEDAIIKNKVDIRLYSDTPLCFLVITEERLFIEHYHFAGRGGQNVIFAIKGKTNLFRIYEDHFEALWRDSTHPKPEIFCALLKGKNNEDVHVDPPEPWPKK